MSRFVPYRSYSKIGKNLSTYKNNQYFQLKLCVITPKILLSNLI